jgi:hypothetical protein
MPTVIGAAVTNTTTVVVRNEKTGKRALVRWSQNMDVDVDRGSWVVEECDEHGDIDSAGEALCFADDRADAIAFALDFVEFA